MQSRITFPLPKSAIRTDYRPVVPPDVPDGVDMIALDTETSGLRWWDGDTVTGIAIAWIVASTVYAYYLPCRHPSGGNLNLPNVIAWLRHNLKNKFIINLNTRFDLHNTRESILDLSELNCRVGDIAHYAALLDDHRKSFNLNSIAQDYLGESKIDLDMSQGAQVYHPSEIEDYAKQDVILVLKLYEKMLPLLEHEDLLRVKELEDKCIWPTVEMEKNGALLDTEKLIKWNKDLQAENIKIVKHIYSETGILIEPSRPTSLNKLFPKLNIDIPPSFDDATLSKFDHPIIGQVRHSRRLLSLQNKYVKRYLEETERTNILRYALRQLRSDGAGTVSGRYSSTGNGTGIKPDGVNIQQVMRPDRHKELFGDDYVIRELFIPESGTWFSADAKQIEYRLFAHFSKSAKILQAYEDDPETDFHNIVKDMVHSNTQSKADRTSCKNLNFAKLYGAGIKKIAAMLGVSEEQAKRLVSAYDRAFPEASILFNKASRLAETRGYVKTILGRRARFNKDESPHKALNRVIQGSAADINKQKLIELYETRKQTGFKMRFTVHDEVDGDVPDLESARMIEEILNRQSFDLRVPILWDCNTGKNWKECK